jgi:acetyltransferase-like isoleucine patch superfamily enzyme
MAYLSDNDLLAMGFAALGRNVKISDKAAIYGPEQMRIGDHSRIDDFCVVSGKVEIGRNVHFAPFCLVAGGRPGVTFKDFSGLAYGAKVFSQSDDYSGQTMTNPTVPAELKSEQFDRVEVGRHAIVGAGSVICPGVILAEGTAVGALSLVLRSTEAWSIYIGNPARKLRDRKRDLLELEREYLARDELLGP